MKVALKDIAEGEALCMEEEVSVSFPGEESDPVALPDGMIVSPVVVYFDSWGKPYNVVPSPSAESITITVTIDTEAITITKNTGFIA